MLNKVGLIEIKDGTVALPGIPLDTDTDTGLYKAGTDALGVSVAGSKVGEYNTNGWQGLDNVAIFNEEQTSGVAGGTFTSGAWRDRILNTSRVNRISGLSLNTGTGEMTFPAGTFRIEAWAVGYSVERHSIQIWNSTAGSELIYGMGSYSPTSFSGNIAATLGDEFTLGSSASVKLRHICQATQAGNGFGLSLGASLAGLTREVYSRIKITRIA